VRAFAAAGRRDVGAAIRHFQAAAAAFQRIGNHRDWLAQRIDETYALLEVGAYAQAEAQLVPLLEEVKRSGLTRLWSVKLNLAIARACQGKDGVAAAREVVQGVDRTHSQSTLSSAYLAATELLCGDLENAEASARRAAADLAYDVRPILAYVLLARGRDEEAAVLMTEPLVGDGVMARPLAGVLPDAAARLAAFDRAGRAEAPAAARAAWEALIAYWRALREPELRATFRRMYDVELILKHAPRHGVDVSEIADSG
jgi:hypothetical protein